MAVLLVLADLPTNLWSWPGGLHVLFHSITRVIETDSSLYATSFIFNRPKLMKNISSLSYHRNLGIFVKNGSARGLLSSISNQENAIAMQNKDQNGLVIVESKS